ncbi:MAG: hypothetical protein ABSB70_24050 [Candidatus Velthaea sp.]
MAVLPAPARLHSDVAAAHPEAGFRVIGAAIAGDAARTLGKKRRSARALSLG